MYKIAPVKFFCQKVLPFVYDDSLSYYEVLCKFSDTLNQVIENQNELTDDLQNMMTWVNTQLETYSKEQLESWKNDGTLAEIINEQLFSELEGKIDSVANYFSVNVKDYGAKGDGVTDDTQAFKNALIALGESDTYKPIGETGGVLFIPLGSYIITDSLFIPAGVSIIGQGTNPLLSPQASLNGKQISTIIFNPVQKNKILFEYRPYNTETNTRDPLANFSFMTNYSAKTRANGLRIKNLQINGEGCDIGIKLSGAPNTIISDVNISGFKCGIFSNYIFNSCIEHCQIVAYANAIVLGEQSQGTAIRDCYLTSHSTSTENSVVKTENDTFTYSTGVYCYKTSVEIDNVIVEYFQRAMYFEYCPQVHITEFYTEAIPNLGIDFRKSCFVVTNYYFTGPRLTPCFNFVDIQKTSYITNMYPDVEPGKTTGQYIRNLFLTASGAPGAVQVKGYTGQADEDNQSLVVFIDNGPRTLYFTPTIRSTNNNLTVTYKEQYGYAQWDGFKWFINFKITLNTVSPGASGGVEIVGFPDYLIPQYTLFGPVNIREMTAAPQNVGLLYSERTSASVLKLVDGTPSNPILASTMAANGFITGSFEFTMPRTLS